MKNKKHEKIAFVIVAILLVALTTTSATFSWIDDVKQVQFDNDNLTKNGAPLKSGVDINAGVVIKDDNNTVNLGNILQESDLVYEYTEDGKEKKHTNYDGGSHQPNWSNINTKKGYFYESGDMHLSPCYSDGETFYFPRQGTDGYREGNKDDENVNYISFTTKVSSPDANVDFWFDSLPTVKVHGTDNVISTARFSITADGKSHVYSASGSANTVSGNSLVAVSGTRKTSTYTYGNNDNTTTARGANSNTLFSVKKGDTVNLNIKIWLEGGTDATITASDINMVLVSSWAYSRRIWIEDKTTNGGGGSWLNDNSAKLYLTFPALLKEQKSNVAEWSNEAHGWYTLQPSNNKYYVDVPLVYNNEEMILYRCNSEYWNNNGQDAQQRSPYNVYCWNWWRTFSPNTYEDATYTLYGGSMDSTANGYFNSINQGFEITNKGYGTWGAVEQIQLYSVYNGNDLATKGSGKAMYVVDYSDEDTSRERYIYEMYRSGTTKTDAWMTWVPASSSKIQFRYFGGAVGLSWGYNSWGGDNPQRRPMQSTGLYSANALQYNLGAIFNNVDGWGFWSVGQTPIDMVYLVKRGTLFGYANTVYDYLYDGNGTPNKNHDWPGVQMTQLKDTSNNDVKWRDGISPVLKSDAARTGASTIYNNLMFNNGGNADGDKTGTLNVYPGCFYNPDDGKWYGTIDDNGRDASTSGGGGGDDSGGGSDTGGGSMSGYSEDTNFTFQINNQTYYAKTNGTDFKVSVPLAAGENWTTVQYNGTDMGLEASGEKYDVKDGMDLYLTKDRTNNFALRAQTAGTFVVSFKWENDNTIKITSTLKSS